MVGLVDCIGNVVAPMICSSVNNYDSGLLPESFTVFKQVAHEVGLPIKGKELVLDKGFDGKRNRKLIWNAGMVPVIPENVKNRNTSKPKRGRPRHFNLKSYHERHVIERLNAWHDTYRATVIRYDRKLANFMGHCILAFTLINLRHFCGRSQ